MHFWGDEVTEIRVPEGVIAPSARLRGRRAEKSCGLFVEVVRSVRCIEVRVNGKSQRNWKQKTAWEEYIGAGEAVASFLEKLFEWNVRFQDAEFDCAMSIIEETDRLIHLMRWFFHAIAQGVKELAESLPVDWTLPGEEYPQAILWRRFELNHGRLKRHAYLDIREHRYPVPARTRTADEAISYLKRDADLWQGDIGFKRAENEPWLDKTDLGVWRLTDQLNSSHVLDSVCFNRYGHHLAVPYPTRVLHAQHASLELEPGIYRLSVFGGDRFYGQGLD